MEIKDNNIPVNDYSFFWINCIFVQGAQLQSTANEEHFPQYSLQRRLLSWQQQQQKNNQTTIIQSLNMKDLWSTTKALLS